MATTEEHLVTLPPLGKCLASLTATIVVRTIAGEEQTDYPGGLGTPATDDLTVIESVRVDSYWFGIAEESAIHRAERPEWFALLDEIAHDYISDHWEGQLEYQARMHLAESTEL